MSTTESNRQGPLAAGTTTFQLLLGGKYGVLATASWGGGSATLKALAADGTTYVTVLAAITADGYVTVDLPPGQYEWVVATSTGVYVTVARIPI